jgi:pimeloyl-ACP methyl ester carboxylesterase
MRRFDPSMLRLYVDEGFEATGHGTVALRCRPEWEVAAYLCGMTSLAFERLGEVSCPVTVAVGDAGSAAARAGHEREAAERLPLGEFVTIEGTDHFGPQVEPRQVAEIVQRWIDEGPSS